MALPFGPAWRQAWRPDAGCIFQPADEWLESARWGGGKFSPHPTASASPRTAPRRRAMEAASGSQQEPPPKIWPGDTDTASEASDTPLRPRPARFRPRPAQGRRKASRTAPGRQSAQCEGALGLHWGCSDGLRGRFIHLPAFVSRRRSVPPRPGLRFPRLPPAAPPGLLAAYWLREGRNSFVFQPCPVRVTFTRETESRGWGEARWR